MHLSFSSSTFKDCNGGADAKIFFAFFNTLGYVEFDNCLFIGDSNLNYDQTKNRALEFQEIF